MRFRVWAQPELSNSYCGCVSIRKTGCCPSCRSNFCPPCECGETGSLGWAEPPWGGAQRALSGASGLERGGEGVSSSAPASYLSTSPQSCSDTAAFSRRRSPGPFLGSPFVPSPGDLGKPARAAPPAPQWAMSAAEPECQAAPDPDGGVPEPSRAQRSPPRKKSSHPT